MYLLRKIFFFTISVILFAVFAPHDLQLFAQQSPSSQLITVAVLPFESIAQKYPKKYRFIGWGLHYLINSRLQNVPGIYCLSAEEIVNIYPSKIKKYSKVSALETIQENLKSNEKINEIHFTLGVDILIYGYYHHHDKKFVLYAKRNGFDQPPEKVEFLRADLAKENVFAVLIERIIKLINSVNDLQNDAFNKFYKTFNKDKVKPIFAHLPDYKINTLSDENKENKDKYDQFLAYSKTWNNYATSIRNNDKCDTFHKNFSDKSKKSLLFTRNVDGLVLDAYIQLHNKNLDILPRQYEIPQFQNALQANPDLVAAQLGQIKTWWKIGKLEHMRNLIWTIRHTESRNPWFDIYQIAYELAVNDQWDESKLNAMQNISKRVPWLTTGFDTNREWAAAMLAKFFAARNKIFFMEKVLSKISPYDNELNNIALSYLTAEMHMRKEEYIVAYRKYKHALDLLQDQDKNPTSKRRHLYFFNQWLFEPDYLENKVKQCRHVLYKKRLPGSGEFLKVYKKYASGHPFAESATALSQDPKTRIIYVGTNLLNVYRLLSYSDKFEDPIVNNKDFINLYAEEGKDTYTEDKIKLLQFDVKGNLWITTARPGLFQWDGQFLRKFYICKNNTLINKRDENIITTFLIDNKKNIFWIAPLDGKIKKCTFNNENICLDCESKKVKSDQYTSIFNDSSDNIYTSNEDSVYYYDDYKEDFIELFNSDRDILGQSIIKVIVYHSGTDFTKLWIVTRDDSISSYNQWIATVNHRSLNKTLTFEGLLSAPRSHAMKGFFINKILSDPTGELWVGTRKEGLLNVKEKTIFDYNNFLIEGEDVFDLLWDNGLLWIASQKGVRRLNFDTVITYNIKDGLPGNVVYAIAGSDSGEIYIGTSAGLSVYRNGLFEKLSIKEIDDVLTRGVYGLLYDSDTGLWCRGGNWLHHFPISDSVFVNKGYHYKLEDDFSSRKKEIQMEIVADKTRGGVWISTNRGLCFVYNNPDIDPLYLNLPNSDFRPTAPVIDIDQSLWFARKDIIYHIKKKDIDHFFEHKIDDTVNENILNSIPIDLNIFNIEFDNYSIGNVYVNLIRLKSNGHSKGIWLGTSAGVIKFQPSTNEFKLKNKKLGVPNIPVMVTTLEFVDESLWIGSNLGLTRYNFKYKQSSFYNHQYGLQNLFVRSIGCFEKDKMWVGTSEGLASFRLRSIAPLILKPKKLNNSVGDAEYELTPVFYRESPRDLRYLLLNEKTGDFFWLSQSHDLSSNSISENPDFTLHGNRLSIKGLSPGNYSFSIRVLSREFQLTPEKQAKQLQFKIPYLTSNQKWLLAIFGLFVLFFSLAFYLSSQHARKRFGLRWAAMSYCRKLRKSQDSFILIIYSIFQKTDSPEKILEYIRAQTASGKDKNLSVIIQYYLYLTNKPKIWYNLARLLKKAKHLKYSQDIGNLYHIISELLNKSSMTDIAALQLKLDANKYRLESNVNDGVDIPEFLSIDIIKQLVLLDKTLSILAQIASESDFKYQWYYLTAADKILRDILAGSLQATTCPEKNVIISIAKQYSVIVQKEMNRVIAVERKMSEGITDHQIIRHIVEKEYPAPISYLYSMAQKEDNPVIKADYELDLLSLLVRQLAYLVISDYMSIPKIEERIDLSFLAKKPLSDGEWNSIFRNIVAALRATCHNHSIPEIYEEFSQKQSIKLLGDLIKLRNDIVHRRKRDIQTISHFNEYLTSLLEKLHFFKDLDWLIVRKVSAGVGPFKLIKFLKARGDIFNLDTIKVTTGISLKEHRVVVHNPLQSRVINLYPFLRYESCSLCKDHHIFYFSDVSCNRARYLSASTGCIIESRAYQNEIVEYLDPTSEIKTWIGYHVFKEDKELN